MSTFAFHEISSLNAKRGICWKHSHWGLKQAFATFCNMSLMTLWVNSPDSFTPNDILCFRACMFADVFILTALSECIPEHSCMSSWRASRPPPYFKYSTGKKVFCYLSQATKWMTQKYDKEGVRALLTGRCSGLNVWTREQERWTWSLELHSLPAIPASLWV